MAVHSAGTGSGWLENLDLDQPHGLDYREFNDLRIGIRKRLAKEHVTFAGTTAGGEHLPGQCGVLLVCDDTADFTALVDATTAPLGSIAYCITHANLWCITATASGAAPDFTVIKLGPLSFCLGADYTWVGAHEFDGSVDFTATVGFGADTTLNIGGDMTIGGVVDFDGTVNFNSSVDFSSDVTVSFLGDVSVTDGTVAGKPVHYGQRLTARAWVRFEVDGGAVTVLDNENVSAVNDGGVGDYSVNWDTNFADVNYCCIATATGFTCIAAKYLVGSCTVRTFNSAANLTDATEVCVAAFGTI